MTEEATQAMADGVELEAPQVELPADPPEEYAIVEIFGHRSHVGRVMEVDRFGAKLLRIDVPTDGDFAKGFVSHFYGGSSIFSFTNCDLATVQKHNKQRSEPPRPYTTRAQVPALDYDDDPLHDDHPDED